ncbi:MAG: DUF2333 family protein, partial [Natronospirillum sp.]
WNFTHRRWLFPGAENEYGRGLAHLERYLKGVVDGSAEFHVRQQDLEIVLNQAENRLTTLVQALVLSARRDDRDRQRVQLMVAPTDVQPATPRLSNDDVFYQSRGYGWALVHTLQAIALDYEGVLPSAAWQELDGAILELASLQRPVWAPVLNSDGFGLFTNHVLVAAGHLGRAHQHLAALNLMVAAD